MIKGYWCKYSVKIEICKKEGSIVIDVFMFCR